MAVMPGMQALQATLGQFMGTVNEMVERLAQREGPPPRRETGRPHRDIRREPPEELEGLCRRLVAESEESRLIPRDTMEKEVPGRTTS